MKNLIEGVRRFHSQPNSTYKEIAVGQDPKVLFIGCSDSRVVPAFLADADPGDLFTIRNVGNQIPQVDALGLSRSDFSEAAAVEYSLLKLQVEDVVVCGHSNCGAMAAIAGGLAELPVNLRRWLGNVESVLNDSAFPLTVGQNLTPLNRLSQRNVLLQLRNLVSYSFVQAALAHGKLRLHGWWLDLEAARIVAYSGEAFVDFDEAYRKIF